MSNQKKDRVFMQFMLAVISLLAFVAAIPASAEDADPDPVLMVIANQDFWYAEYASTRASLEAAGLEVVVAAATTDVARPQDLGTRAQRVQPDLALTDVNAEDYSGIVFSGGWGMAQYQYGFEGTYSNHAYNAKPRVVRALNTLIGRFLEAGKPVAAICHGVSVLAYARVDGVSPLRGRVVVGYAGGSPGFRLGRIEYADGEVPMRWHIEGNGATMLTSGSVGDPLSTSDDVFVDGRIITAENWDSAARFAGAIAQAVAANPN